MATNNNDKGASVKKVTLITDASALAKEGRELAKSILDNDKRIGIYLLSEIAHIEEHRNPTRLNMFFSWIKGSGARVNAMHTFIQMHANLRFNEDATKSGEKGKPFQKKAEDGSMYTWFYDVKAKRAKSLFEKKMAQAQAKAWWEYRPEPAPTAYVFEDKLAGVLKGAWGALTRPKKDDGSPRFSEVQMDRAFLNELTELAMKHGVKVDIPDPQEGTELDEEVKNYLDHLAHVNDNEETEGEGTEGAEANPAETSPELPARAKTA